MESRLRANHEQFSMMLEFMESHGDLSRLQPGLQAKLRSEHLWQELAKRLNSAGGGVNKATDKWKRVWSDWKTKTKKKASIIHRKEHGSKRKPLNSLEKRVLQISGIASIIGNSALKEVPISSHHQTHDTERVPSPMDEQLAVISSSPVPIPTSTPTILICKPAPHINAMAGPSNCLVQEERSRFLQSPHRTRNRRRYCRHNAFDRAASEFLPLEKIRLRLEKEREARLHKLEKERDARLHELERERVRLEAERIQLERDRLQVEAEKVRVDEIRARTDAERLEIDRDLLTVAQQLSAQVVTITSLLNNRPNVI